MASDIASRSARFEAPPKQITTPTNHCLHLLPHRRRREEPRQACQEDEEEQHLN